jgi:hypothetical protein
LFAELKVSAHLMTFDTGLYCVVQTPGVRRPDDGTGLPGVRLSLPPAPTGRADSVSFASFRPDGWLSGAADAMLVRVASGPSQVLVTIYQAPIGTDTAPRLQVLRLSEDPGAAVPGSPGAAPGPMAPGMPAVARQGFAAGVIPEVVAHAQIKGDIGAAMGEWIGEKGSKRWIEGFMLNPRGQVGPADIEYQAVLGRGWLSPWVEGGQICGSRGMALPVLGLRIRLRGTAATTHSVRYAATFVDGSAVGPVDAGEACEAESLAPLEAFQVMLLSKTAAAQQSATKQATKAAPKEPAVAEPVKPTRSIRGKTPAAAKKR